VSRKRDKKNLISPTENMAPPFLSRKGWMGLGGGIFLLFLGFLTLSFTDPAGKNFASDLSPLLLVSGYALIAFAIWRGTPRNDKF